MIAISVFAGIMLGMAQQAKALHLKIVPGGEKEAFACERVTVKPVLSRKTKIAIGWIITGIAIAFVWICATGSHDGLKTLISAGMGVVFVAVFIALAITASIGRSEEGEVEMVVEILKRARIKEAIERRGENLTYDMML